MNVSEPPTVVVEVHVVGGEEGDALRAAQARAIRELLLWAGESDANEE